MPRATSSTNVIATIGIDIGKNTTSSSWTDGTQASMRRGEMFLHLVTHGSYHRGWVAEMFLEADVRPPQPDLSVFLCEAPRDWRASI